jgi:hypothetical protein
MRHDKTLEELWRTAPATTERFHPDRLEGLPPAVQRYLGHALAPGAPLSTCMRLTMTGSIKLDSGWCPFEGEQVLRWDRGFVWAARAKVNGLPVTGFDRLVDGEGAMRWKVLGLFPVVKAEGDQIARSAAGRLHAEAMWLPAVLLGDDVRWSETDATHPHATIRAHGETSELELTLDETGALQACALPRWGDLDSGQFAYHAFGGTCAAERTFDGITIPTEHRVGWHFGTDRFASDGEFFRCTLQDVQYR